MTIKILDFTQDHRRLAESAFTLLVTHRPQQLDAAAISRVHSFCHRLCSSDVMYRSLSFFVPPLALNLNTSAPCTTLSANRFGQANRDAVSSYATQRRHRAGGGGAGARDSQVGAYPYGRRRAERYFCWRDSMSRTIAAIRALTLAFACGDCPFSISRLVPKKGMLTRSPEGSSLRPSTTAYTSSKGNLPPFSAAELHQIGWIGSRRQWQLGIRRHGVRQWLDRSHHLSLFAARGCRKPASIIRHGYCARQKMGVLRAPLLPRRK